MSAALGTLLGVMLAGLLLRMPIGFSMLASVALPASWDYVRFMAREGTPVLGIPLFWVYLPFVFLLVAVVLRCGFAVWQALRRHGLDAELRL